MRADLALDAMSDLLNSWLGRNCKDGDEKYPLKQNVEGSDEWSEFEKAIAEAEEKRKGMASASVESTNAIVPTSLGVQQKEKGAESEPEAAIGALGRPASNRKKIRKSKSAEGGPRWSAEFQSNLRSETWLKQQPSLAQKEAAYSLAISSRQITNLLNNKTLNKAPQSKRILVAPKFWSHFHLTHSAPK